MVGLSLKEGHVKNHESNTRDIKYYLFSNVSISSSVSIRYKCVIHMSIDHSLLVACVMFLAFRLPNCRFF